MGESASYEFGISYLWFNLIGPVIVISVALLIESLKGQGPGSSSEGET